MIGFVPSDYQTAVTSINLGRPLVQSDANCKIALEIKRIAKTIARGAVLIEEAAKPKPRLWNSLFKRDVGQKAFELQASLEKV